MLVVSIVLCCFSCFASADAPDSDVVSRINELEKDPVIHDMVDQYAPNPERWWDWYNNLPIRDEEFLDKLDVLLWIKSFGNMSEENRQYVNYNPLYFAESEANSVSSTMDDFDVSSYAVVLPPDDGGFLPTGGYEHTYDEALWGDPVREKANCYAYALNTYSYKNDLKYQIGYSSLGKYKDVTYIREHITELLAADAPYFNGKTIVPTTASAKPGYRQYKIAVAFSICDSYPEFPEARNDFHFYRQDKGGYWSHKRGFGGYIENVDASNYKISDPRTCDRDYGYDLDYSDFAGYYMVTY